MNVTFYERYLVILLCRKAMLAQFTAEIVSGVVELYLSKSGGAQPMPIIFAANSEKITIPSLLFPHLKKLRDSLWLELKCPGGLTDGKIGWFSYLEEMTEM